MKMLTLLLTMAVAIVLLSSPSDARHDTEKDTGDDKTPASKKHKPGKEPTTRKKPLLRGMHARMVLVCGLNESQQLRIAELNALRRKAMKQFNADNAEKFKTFKAQIAEARKNKDKQATKDAYAKIRSLRVKQREIYTQWRSKIMGVLTPEQKSLWAKDQFILSIKRKFRKVKLTDKQTAEVKAACAKSVMGVDLSDKKVRREAVNKLAEYIRKEILTDAQRAATTRPARKTTTKPSDSPKPSKAEKVKAGKIANDK